MRILKKRSPLKNPLILFLATFVATVGIYCLLAPNDLSNRKPAQFNKVSSSLENMKEFKRKVISTLKLEKLSGGEAQITMTLPAEVCQQYQRFDLNLEAEGIALNGEPVQIIKSKSCTDLDTETLEMSWQVSLKDQPALVDVMVETWNIKALSFIPQASQKPLRITGYEFIYVLGAPASVQLRP